ncbi:MAG: hypothetical protein Tsb008_09000 [Rhodothalassiaceae bacterium]
MKRGRAEVRTYDREGWALSIAMHATLAAAILIGLPHLGRDLPDIPDLIPVDFVMIDERTTTDRHEEPEPAAAKPEPLTAREEAPPPVASAEAVPLPDSPAPKQPVAKPEPKPAPPAPVLRVAPRVKPKPPVRFDERSLASLIDKSAKKLTPPAPKTEAEEKPKEAARPTPLSASIVTATLQEAIRQKVQGCWSVPAGARDAGSMRVTIRLTLGRDGRLLRQPQIVDAGDLSAPGREFYRTVAESARRAVQICEPYDMLPPENYDLWRQMEFVFDPSEMLGG